MCPPIDQPEIEERGAGLTEHLTELRTRLIYSLYGLLVTTSISYWQSELIMNLVREPITKFLPDGGLVYTAPTEKYMAHLKLSIAFGLILSCPYWLYHLWKFIAPGLYKNERKYMAWFIVAGTGLFLFGCFFSYYVAMPMAFEYLFTFGGDIDKPMITVDRYIDFFAQFCVMFGLSFELPLILAVLGMMGIISQKTLIEKGRYAVMILAFLAALITPPDVLSMLIMLVPLVALYYLGVFFVGFFEKKKPS